MYNIWIIIGDYVQPIVGICSPISEQPPVSSVSADYLVDQKNHIWVPDLRTKSQIPT